jgi:hypothetical protein
MLDAIANSFRRSRSSKPCFVRSSAVDDEHSKRQRSMIGYLEVVARKSRRAAFDYRAFVFLRLPVLEDTADASMYGPGTRQSIAQVRRTRLEPTESRSYSLPDFPESRLPPSATDRSLIYFGSATRAAHPTSDTFPNVVAVVHGLDDDERRLPARGIRSRIRQ